MELDPSTIAKLAAMGPLGFVILFVIIVLIVYMKIKAKDVQTGQDINQGGSHAGDQAVENNQELEETRKPVDDFLKRPPR